MAVRWDSPFVLATAGTLAVHLLLITAGDAFVVYNPPQVAKPAPRIEMVEVEVPPVLEPPPPPAVKEPEPTPPPEPPPVQKTVARTQVRPQTRSIEPVPTTEEPPPTTPEPASGGEQVVQMEAVLPGQTGVGVLQGKRTSEKVGRGGTGGGTGAGAGSGSEDAPPKPTSVATIKKRAMPKGDFGYFKAGKDYPPEARQLGIEGKILVRLIVDETGKVRSTTLISKLGHGLDELALERAKELVFDPAIDTDNRPVSSVVVWTFDMTLPK